MCSVDESVVEDIWEVRDPGVFQAYTLGADPVTPLQVPGIRFATFEPARQTRLAEVMHVSAGEVQRRLDEGGQAVLALSEETQIAGYGWIRYDAIQIDDLELHLPLPPDHAYIWDCLTVPELRGRGIFPALLRFMLEALRQEGIQLAWAGVAPGNESSLRAFARAGFRKVAEIGHDRDSVRIRILPAAKPAEISLLTMWRHKQ